MDPNVIKELSQEQPTPFHTSLLEHCKGLVTLSRSKMSGSYHERWRESERLYRNQRTIDKSDKAAQNRGEPTKGVIPLTRSQVLSYVVLTMSVLLQRKKFYELEPVGPEDAPAAKAAEALLDNDLRYNKVASLLWQLLLDNARFGVTVASVAYKKRYKNTLVKETVPPPIFLGQPVGEPQEVVTMKRVLDFAGNEILPVSPFAFYPDWRLPITRFQEGEFCACDKWMTHAELSELEANGEVAGIEFIGPLSQTDLESTVKPEFDLDPLGDPEVARSQSQTKGMVLVTEVQVKIVPSRFEVDGKPLGESKSIEKWNVWIANNNRIIAAEPLGYMHDRFTFAVGCMYPDHRRFIAESMVDAIDHIQDVVSWLINSHIANVRKVVGDKLLVRSRLVNMKDLVERNPVIRINDHGDDRPLSDIIQQLHVQDVTQNHFQSASFLTDLAQIATGITDNAQGAFHVGRRSGTEASSVLAAVNARLRYPTLQLWESLFSEMGRQMISNHQQGLDSEIYVRNVGELADPNEAAQFMRVQQSDLAGSYDFAIFDGTTAGERTSQAEAMGELLVSMPGGFQTLLWLGYDPQKLMQEWLVLRGIRHPERFKLDQVNAQIYVERLLAMQQLQNGGPNNPAAGGDSGVPSPNQPNAGPVAPTPA